MLGWDFEVDACRDSEDEIWSRFVFELVWTLVSWTQASGPLCLWQCLNSLATHLILLFKTCGWNSLTKLSCLWISCIPDLIDSVMLLGRVQSSAVTSCWLLLSSDSCFDDLSICARWQISEWEIQRREICQATSGISSDICMSLPSILHLLIEQDSNTVSQFSIPSFRREAKGKFSWVGTINA